MDLSFSDPLRIDLDGSPFWRFEDGTLLPVISGGADDGGAGGGEGGDGDAGDAGADDKGGQDDKGKGDDGKVEFTPEQEAAIGKRIAEERAKAAAAAKKAAEDEAKQAAERAKMDEAERAKAEKADAEKKAADAVAAANARVIAAEAKVQAVEAGADPKQLAYVLRLADLSDIDVDDAGVPDAKAIRKAVDKVLSDVPALKNTGNGKGRSGGDMNGGGDDKKAGSLEEAVAAKLG